MKMKSIFFIILSIILSTTNSVKPKLCVDCKFFIKDNFVTPNEFGKCALFPKVKKNDDYLVDGKKRYDKTEYSYCSIMRKYEDSCGEEGRLYEKR
jgi:hypothetical protein